jgi:hypothetical protein
MFFTVSIQITEKTANSALKSRVWENHKHGSVGGITAIKPKQHNVKETEL